MESRQLGATLVLVALVSGVFLWTQAQDMEKENSVEKIEEKLEAGNFGTRSNIKVILENGSSFEYESYRSHHPLCPSIPEKCGEDSIEIGWKEANKLIHSKNFTAKEDTSYPTVHFPKSTVCMKSNTSYVPC